MQQAVLATLVNAEEISELYLKDSPILFSNIKKSLSAELETLNHRKLLTLNLVAEGRVHKTLEPKPNKEYAKSLLLFIANKNRDGYSIDSFLTPVITKVVEEEFVAFYSDEQRVKEVLLIIDKRLSEIKAEYNMHSDFYDQLDMEKVMDFGGQNAQANEMTKSMLGQFSTETMLNAFKQVMGILGKASYKAVILNMGKTILSSGVASFIKPIILGVLGKIGLAAIAKTAVAKALAVIIGVGSIAVSVPAAYILLPIVIAFLSYETYKLPQKLGGKLPEEISRKLEAEFEKINRSIAEEMTGGFLMELEAHLVEAK